ncbi:MAG TPA: tetratricopeptide repeat protein [Gammaproteobacteria bacterium]
MIRILLLVFCLSLAACASQPPRDWSTGDEDEAPAIQNPAVVALMAEAERQQAAGNHGLAASALERALRIAPHDAALRIELGRLRLEQGDPFQAKELARMAVVYAGEQHALQADAWDLIAAAERMIGNQVEATLAAEEAARLRDE